MGGIEGSTVGGRDASNIVYSQALKGGELLMVTHIVSLNLRRGWDTVVGSGGGGQLTPISQVRKPEIRTHLPKVTQLRGSRARRKSGPSASASSSYVALLET